MRTAWGNECEYLTIEVKLHGIRLRVPADGSAQSRLRPLASRAEARRALDLLSAPAQSLASNWRLRQKEAERSLSSGRLLEVAALVRDFAAAARLRRPAGTDRALYDRARGLLEGELQVALRIGAARAAAEIDSRLADRAAQETGEC